MNLEQRMMDRIKVQGKSSETFETYWYYVKGYLAFCADVGIGKETRAEKAVERWLTWLAQSRHVSKNTQNVALQAVCYLYREVLNRPLVGVSAFRSKRPTQVRDVASVESVSRLFDAMDGQNLLAAQIMYATGLRVGLAVSLRVKDLLFDRNQILVHSAKGDKGRYVSFPSIIHDAVRQQLDSVRVLHQMDCDGANPNGVSLPGAFRRKSPRAACDWTWQYLFPSDNLSKGSEGVLCRHHRDPSTVSKAIKNACREAGIEQRITSHILRHSYATHAHEMGVPMRTLQVLLGHSDIRTTEIYVHADQHQATASASPIESLMQHLARPRQIATPETKPRLRVVG